LQQSFTDGDAIAAVVIGLWSTRHVVMNEFFAGVGVDGLQGAGLHYLKAADATVILCFKYDLTNV